MAKDAHTDEPGHPIPAAVARARAAVRTVADVPAWSLSGSETREALVGIAQARAALDELEARLLSEGDTSGAFAEVGATSAAAWLAHATRMTRREARRRVALAGVLADLETTRESMSAGQMLADQAAEIGAAVSALPKQPEVRQRCEKELVRLAEHHDARELKILGRRVLEVVDPAAADAHEAALLEAEEKAAARATSFSMWDDGTGTVRGRFTLPALEGGMLRKALTAIAAPKHQRAVGQTYGRTRPSPERLGQAFAEYVTRYPADKLPHAGGINATVVVTMTLDTLEGGLGAATIDTGGRLSACAVRRLACEAGLVPMVLDGASQPVDVGRQQRFHTQAQRLALAVTQRHCQAPGCDVPAWLCHVHHDQPWHTGGHTNVRDARLYCPRHHTLVHREPPAPVPRR
ncbi:HNH endonuclease signature motif containing protein [Nocardioides marinquilinus]